MPSFFRSVGGMFPKRQAACRFPVAPIAERASGKAEAVRSTAVRSGAFVKDDGCASVIIEKPRQLSPESFRSRSTCWRARSSDDAGVAD